MGRRGPKRHQGKREPNGQISRRQEAAAARAIDRDDKVERETLAVGIAARKRVHGVDLQVAQDQRAGSVVGRWCMEGIITDVQYQAALRWQTDALRYSIAMRSPRQPGAVDLNATKGGNGDFENVRAAQKAYDDHELAIQAVQDHQNQIRGGGALYAALYYVLQRDLDARHMRGDLNMALNTLARHYGLDTSRAAA